MHANDTGLARTFTLLLSGTLTLFLVVSLFASGTVAGAEARTGSAPPSSDIAQAFSYANEHYRRPLGLPDLSWSDATAKAAAAHVHYWVLNGFGTFHEEVPGKPGFTGVEPWDRCEAAGAEPCGEVAYAGLQMPEAVAGWLNTPYHGLPFFDSQLFGCAESKVGSVCDMSGASDAFGGQQPNYAAAVNTASSPVRIWPYDGATDVPTTWQGGESPDPLANFTGDKTNVGPTLFVGVAEAATVSLHAANGAAVPLLAPEAAAASPTLSVNRGYFPIGWTAFFAARKLKPNVAYTLTITDSASRSWSTRFTTLGEDPQLSLSVDESGVTVSAGAGPAKTATVTINDGNGHKLASANVKVDHAWLWPGFRRGGTFTVCADLPSSGAYLAVHNCQQETLATSTDSLLSLGRTAYHGTTATVTLHARGPLLGRRATVTLVASFRNGCGTLCGGWPRGRSQRVVLPLRQRQTFQLPFQTGGGWGMYVSVIVPAFTANGSHYELTIYEAHDGR
jgi:hypothetical protein